MQYLFDRSFASAVVNSALATQVFDIGFKGRKLGVHHRAMICFTTGQPLGTYSSWNLFTLSHHILMWYCAEQVHPGQRFQKYAILGDDVVITDPDVATEYERTNSGLGVKSEIANLS